MLRLSLSRAINSFPLLAFAFVFAFSARSTNAQALGPTVETPTTRQVAVQAAQFVDDNVMIAREDKNVIRDYKDMVDNKSPKEVVEQQAPPSWHWYAEGGYESEYNFRGTNLTPNADGAGFVDVELSRWGFTLGVFDVHQIGDAHSPSFSMGEGGGGGSSGISGVGSYMPETVQTDFNELDLFLQYHHDFGPVDVTVGDIAFLIQRDAQTYLFTSKDGEFGPFPTVGNEQFDRLFVRLSTNVIPHIQPWITYYQTVYNEGEDHTFYKAFHIPPNGSFVTYSSPFGERNTDHGGYLEGRLRGNFPLCDRVEFNPYGVISYSFKDRSEPVFNTPDFAKTLKGQPLEGWNVAQAGVELPIHIIRRGDANILNLVPFAVYSYHISDPTGGTDRNEGWGGAKLAVSF